MPEFLSLLSIPACSYLWRLGGSRNKDYRRYGIPILLTIIGLLAHFSIWIILAGVLHHLILRLPFTLKGNDIDDDDINWFWVMPWAGLISFPAFLHSFNGWVFSAWLVATVVISAFAYLSNFDETRGIIKWNTCEIVFGAACALPFFIATF